MRRTTDCLLFLVLASCAAPTFDPGELHEVRDVYGGVGHDFAATGFFRVEARDGRWWLVTPAGGDFFSFGVNSVEPSGPFAPALGRAPYADAVAARYPNTEAWAEATAGRLESWGFNTLGSWSAHDLFAGRLPYTINLNLAGADWVTGVVPDYFSDEWAASVEERARRQLEGRSDDAFLLGVFLDNELRWGRDWRSINDELLRDSLRLPAGAAGREVAVRFLRERFTSVESFNETWGTQLQTWSDLDALSELPRRMGTLPHERAFLSLVAERYFSVTVAATRRQLPHHLVLGCRFVSVLTPPEALEAAARHVDVISVNAYTFVEGVDRQTASLFGPVVEPRALAGFEAQGKPLLISEFGFRARDSGLPNTWPPIYPTLETQDDRADMLEASVRRALRSDAMVGMHWFEWVDQPASGRFDGENNNWGLVNGEDQPWTPVVERTATLFPRLLAERRARR